LEAKLVLRDTIDEIDLVVKREGPPAPIHKRIKLDEINPVSRKHKQRTTATTLISSVRQDVEYLIDGSCLSLGLLDTGSLRNDFTNCGRAPSALCPRAAAAIAVLELHRPAGSSVDSGDFAAKTLCLLERLYESIRIGSL
jgi:hypothetical protein